MLVDDNNNKNNSNSFVEYFIADNDIPVSSKLLGSRIECTQINALLREAANVRHGRELIQEQQRQVQEAQRRGSSSSSKASIHLQKNELSVSSISAQFLPSLITSTTEQGSNRNTTNSLIDIDCYTSDVRIPQTLKVGDILSHNARFTNSNNTMATSVTQNIVRRHTFRAGIVLPVDLPLCTLSLGAFLPSGSSNNPNGSNSGSSTGMRLLSSWEVSGGYTIDDNVNNKTNEAADVMMDDHHMTLIKSNNRVASILTRRANKYLLKRNIDNSGGGDDDFNYDDEEDNTHFSGDDDDDSDEDSNNSLLNSTSSSSEMCFMSDSGANNSNNNIARYNSDSDSAINKSSSYHRHRHNDQERKRAFSLLNLMFPTKISNISSNNEIRKSERRIKRIAALPSVGLLPAVGYGSNYYRCDTGKQKTNTIDNKYSSNNENSDHTSTAISDLYTGTHIGWSLAEDRLLLHLDSEREDLIKGYLAAKTLFPRLFPKPLTEWANEYAEEEKRLVQVTTAVREAINEAYTIHNLDINVGLKANNRGHLPGAIKRSSSTTVIPEQHVHALLKKTGTFEHSVVVVRINPAHLLRQRLLYLKESGSTRLKLLKSLPNSPELFIPKLLEQNNPNYNAAAATFIKKATSNTNNPAAKSAVVAAAMLSTSGGQMLMLGVRPSAAGSVLATVGTTVASTVAAGPISSVHHTQQQLGTTPLYGTRGLFADQLGFCNDNDNVNNSDNNDNNKKNKNKALLMMSHPVLTPVEQAAAELIEEAKAVRALLFASSNKNPDNHVNNNSNSNASHDAKEITERWRANQRRQTQQRSSTTAQKLQDPLNEMMMVSPFAAKVSQSGTSVDAIRESNFDPIQLDIIIRVLASRSHEKSKNNNDEENTNMFKGRSSHLSTNIPASSLLLLRQSPFLQKLYDRSVEKGSASPTTTTNISGSTSNTNGVDGNETPIIDLCPDDPLWTTLLGTAPLAGAFSDNTTSSANNNHDMNDDNADNNQINNTKNTYSPSLLLQDVFSPETVSRFITLCHFPDALSVYKDAILKEQMAVSKHHNMYATYYAQIKARRATHERTLNTLRLQSSEELLLHYNAMLRSDIRSLARVYRRHAKGELRRLHDCFDQEMRAISGHYREETSYLNAVECYYLPQEVRQLGRDVGAMNLVLEQELLSTQQLASLLVLSHILLAKHITTSILEVLVTRLKCGDQMKLVPEVDKDNKNKSSSYFKDEEASRTKHKKNQSNKQHSAAAILDASHPSLLGFDELDKLFSHPAFYTQPSQLRIISNSLTDEVVEIKRRESTIDKNKKRNDVIKKNNSVNDDDKDELNNDKINNNVVLEEFLTLLPDDVFLELYFLKKKKHLKMLALSDEDYVVNYLNEVQLCSNGDDDEGERKKDAFEKSLDFTQRGISMYALHKDYISRKGAVVFQLNQMSQKELEEVATLVWGGNSSSSGIARTCLSSSSSTLSRGNRAATSTHSRSVDFTLWRNVIADVIQRRGGGGGDGNIIDGDGAFVAKASVSSTTVQFRRDGSNSNLFILGGSMIKGVASLLPIITGKSVVLNDTEGAKDGNNSGECDGNGAIISLIAPLVPVTATCPAVRIPIGESSHIVYYEIEITEAITPEFTIHIGVDPVKHCLNHLQAPVVAQMQRHTTLVDEKLREKDRAVAARRAALLEGIATAGSKKQPKVNHAAESQDDNRILIDEDDILNEESENEQGRENSEEKGVVGSSSLLKDNKLSTELEKQTVKRAGTGPVGVFPVDISPRYSSTSSLPSLHESTPSTDTINKDIRHPTTKTQSLTAYGFSWTNNGLMYLRGKPYTITEGYTVGDVIGFAINTLDGTVKLLKNKVVLEPMLSDKNKSTITTTTTTTTTASGLNDNLTLSQSDVYPLSKSTSMVGVMLSPSISTTMMSSTCTLQIKLDPIISYCPAVTVESTSLSVDVMAPLHQQRNIGDNNADGTSLFSSIVNNVISRMTTIGTEKDAQNKMNVIEDAVTNNTANNNNINNNNDIGLLLSRRSPELLRVILRTGDPFTVDPTKLLENASHPIVGVTQHMNM